ncbi:WcbI family polysaccharide biosynthesis putative acetyltransferase [Roseomonas sp. NAR14]|uniref:WcbI family polysaccharide biosynthesis putative acetyltransferase n=1 Tax=Roseomonas acroporae TaxID=2937791 RepID=A0A9X1Y5N0_9PROT|nr:WcbI family polysaccharide biosynthesis putative acetyltransferase [Roseomonas acroporae]MCK8783505.1 WcbI family polysaccharide biosynthesis putative acetyltransferase [Roseomonas acroporae]
MKPSLVIFGNCQAQGLWAAVSGLPSCAAAYDIAYVPSHPSLGDTDFDPALLRRCRILWEQVGQNQRLPGWETLPEGARHVRFAELSFPILWPFNCVDPRNRPDPPEFPWGVWPYGDRLALQIAKEGLRGEAAAAAYEERGAALIPSPERMLAIEEARGRKRDANADLSMTGYILENFRGQRLFSTYNHASNRLVWEMFRRLLAGTVQQETAVPEAEIAACERRFLDPALKWPNFDNFQMPVHPRLASAYGLAWADEATLYRHYDAGRLTWREFIARYVAYPFPDPAAPPAGPAAAAPRHPVVARLAELSAGIASLSRMFGDGDEWPVEALGREPLGYARQIGNPPPPEAPPVSAPLVPHACRQADLATDAFRYWCARIGHRPLMHRKYWEWFFTAQALWERQLLVPGSRGLAIDNNGEPLPALFAGMGCEVTEASASEAVPASLHDFCWSSNTLSKAGSIAGGMALASRLVSLLRPGGVAVLTLEHNLSSDTDTLETESLSLFRRADIEALCRQLADAGHALDAVDWRQGSANADLFVDRPPYGVDPHLRLRIHQFTVTSFGLIVRRAAG